MKLRNTIYSWLLLSTVLASSQVLAQVASPPAKPSGNTQKAVNEVNSTIGKGAAAVDKKLDKPINAVNKKLDKATSKIDEKLEEGKQAFGDKKERLLAATVRKNTWLMRNYHNLTAYYNIYFNGREAFTVGAEKAAKEYPFDFTQILPIFTFEAKPIPDLVKSDMVRTLEKADKAIKKHSITVKPEIKKGKRMTKKEQEFYNRREFCNSIDDAYLLIAKANVYLHEYELAQLAFELVMADYAYEPTIYEAKIWTALLAGVKQDTQRQREILNEVVKDKKFPVKQYGKLLNAATADLLIREAHYEEAIPKVELALNTSRNRADKQRYRFILGQLYQKTRQNEKAAEQYTRLIRRMPPYDLEFHARLNKAFLSTGTQGESMKKMLLKMADDEKNKEYLDKIYYALAEIEMNAGRTAQGVEYYRMSAANSAKESPQRLLSCYTLAKYYEAHADYESAQAYYDSTAQVMPKEHPDYDLVSNKAQNLGKLAASLRIIRTEDSLQHIARMSDKEREAYVEKQIALAKENAEQRERDAQYQATRAEVDAAKSATLAQPSTGAGKWYFYNPQLIATGLAEFRKTWGARQLADDWRRESKTATIGFASTTTADGSSPQQDGSSDEQLPADQTEAFYLANVPFTDSLMAESNARLMEAMFEAGLTYKNDIRDNVNAIDMFQKLLKRFPNTRHKLEAYFYLYLLYHEQGDEAQANKYRDLLYTEYPDELLTKYVKDPTYVSDNVLKEKQANALFEDAYALYNDAKFDQAAALAQQGLQTYAGLPVEASFKLLHVMASSGTSRSIGRYIAGLNEVVKAYPGTDVATLAAEMLERVKNRELSLIGERDSAETETPAEAAVPYTTEADGSVFVLVVDKENLDQNQLRFNFVAFNADIDADELSVELKPLTDNSMMLIVGKFKTIGEACAYYKKVKAYPAIFKDVAIKNEFSFAITNRNMALFEQSKIISTYNTFFRSQVLPYY